MSRQKPHDFLDLFPGREVAALIQGLENPSEALVPDTDPVLRRLRADYQRSVDARLIHFHAVLDTDEDRDEWDEPGNLRSHEMFATGQEYVDWMELEPLHHFDNQSFHRDEIARWLEAINLKSAYQFNRQPPDGDDKKTSLAGLVFTGGEQMPTPDLSHWNFRRRFQVDEASALMRGQDPEKVPGYGNPDLPIPCFMDPNEPAFSRIRIDFCMGLKWIQNKADAAADIFTPDDWNSWVDSMPAEYLRPHDMQSNSHRYWGLTSISIDDIRALLFDRSEIARWLAVNGLESKYRFDLSESQKDAAFTTINSSVKTGSVASDTDPPAKLAPKSDARKTSIVVERAHKLVQFAQELGYPTPNLPPREGNLPGPKQRIEAVAKQKGFTDSTFNKAWEFASSGGLLRDSGTRKS